MTSPLISVIIVSYNRREFLGDALRALEQQTWRAFETLVIDNGSSDGSAERVARDFPDMRLIRLSENTGFAGGNNCGIRAAQGEYIALLNNDAVPDACWLEELVAAAERHPEAGFLASQVRVYDQTDLLDSAGDGITWAGTAFRRGHLRPAAQYSTEEFVFGASGSAAFFRRTVLDLIGLFDEDFFAVYEDVDLSFRAQLAGHKCLYVPTAMVYHRGSGTIGKYTDFYVYQTQRNVEQFFVKDIPAPLLWLLLPGHFLYNLAGFLFFAFKGRGRTFLRAKRDACNNLPMLLKKRRLIQAQRRVSHWYLLSLLEKGWLARTVREKSGR